VEAWQVFRLGAGRRSGTALLPPHATVRKSMELIWTGNVFERRLNSMSVKVYGCNHVAIEVDDVEKAVAFYQDVFNLEKLDEGEGDAFFKLGEHQFLAIFEVEKVKPDQTRHFGIMVRDENQLAEVREKLTKKYGLKLIPGFRCDFRDPFGNRIQVVDLHDESLVWLLPYQEVQKAGIRF
jgi:catechol 2,3-dioxygenase-like lactoylglutathione lyase family enzyme